MVLEGGEIEDMLLMHCHEVMVVPRKLEDRSRPEKPMEKVRMTRSS